MILMTNLYGLDIKIKCRATISDHSTEVRYVLVLLITTAYSMAPSSGPPRARPLCRRGDRGERLVTNSDGALQSGRWS